MSEAYTPASNRVNILTTMPSNGSLGYETT